jgi:hypothetical protein
VIYYTADQHFAFRNGPVEDIHANNRLSESDMKTLNKYIEEINSVMKFALGGRTL